MAVSGGDCMLDSAAMIPSQSAFPTSIILESAGLRCGEVDAEGIALPRGTLFYGQLLLMSKPVFHFQR